MTSAGSAPAQAQTKVSEGRRWSSWLWLPTLYFSQGIPYVIVMTMSVVMYKRLGISNTDIALYTSWLYLPWVIKPLWSPLVDIIGTKRLWIIAMQFLVSLGLGLAALSVRGTGFFLWSLLLLWLIAFASATHDIAADGFYMLSLSKHEQAWFVGLRSTFYRAAMIVGSGLLVVLAGTLESRGGLPRASIHVRATKPEPGNAPPSTAPEVLINLATRLEAQLSAEGQSAPHIIVQPASLNIPVLERSGPEAQAVIEQASKWNREHSFLQTTTISPRTGSQSSSPKPVSGPVAKVWTETIPGPLENFLSRHFPKQGTIPAAVAGNVGLVSLCLSSTPTAGERVVVTLGRKKSVLEYFGLAKGDAGFRLVEGERFTFDSENWNQPALAVIQLDAKLQSTGAAVFVASSGNIPAAWSFTLLAVAVLFLSFSCWHSLMLAKPGSDGPVTSREGLVKDFFSTLGSFFQKPGIVLALAFILFYRFDEAQLVKVISPFLLDTRAAGGLGLTTSQVGLAYGTFGILALTCGGLLGGFLAARHGLRKMLPVMICSMYLPKLVFVVLSRLQPENFLTICGAVGVEQFGYGFGFTAFMLYLLYFADGPHKTAHYALCTGFMALGMMIPGLWSGWLADVIGYKHFFVWVIFSAIPGFVLALMVEVDPQFGKKAEPNPRIELRGPKEV